MPTLLKSFVIALAGLALAAQAAAQSIIRDTEIEAILREYTDPILVAAGLEPQDVQLFIINDPSLNAFVAGGQRIHLHTGLIIRSETPGQLKGVIAHEAGHIALAHGVRRAQDIAVAQRPAFLAIGLGIAAIAAGAPEVGIGLIASSQQYAALNFFVHTRAQESSADQVAVNYLEDSGQSAAGLVEFFDNFRYQEVLSEARRFAYFRTHPLASDRIAALRQRAEEAEHYHTPPTDRSVRQLEIMHAKLIGFLEPPTRVYQRYPVGDDSEPARYARAISALQSVDVETALREIDSLLEEFPENPYYHELRGQILFEVGRAAESVEHHHRANELAPGETLLLINYARSLIARNDGDDLIAGEAALRDALIAEPDNAFAWSELAAALDKQGRRHEAELATAERSYHIGDYPGAQVFSRRAMQGLDRNSTLWRRASDIAAVTDPRIPENARAFRRR